MKQTFLLLIVITIFSCNRKNENKSYYDSGNLKSVTEYETDSLYTITDYYDNVRQEKYKVLFNKEGYDSIVYYYKNGNAFKTGLRNKNGVNIKKWNFYRRDGRLSETREFLIIKGEQELNQNWYYNEKGDTVAFANKKFNNYEQKEFLKDTLNSRMSNYAIFNYSDEPPLSEKVTIANPLKASVLVQGIYDKSEIMVLLAKENNNFNKNFSNISEVKFDTFVCVKKDKINGYIYRDSNQNMTAVFGRRFKSTGKKNIRGYVTEYYEKKVDSTDKLFGKFKTVTNERRIYFEKEVNLK